MKKFSILLIICIYIISCKKDTDNAADMNAYMDMVKISLRDSLSAEDYKSLNFNKAILSRVDSAAVYVVRIPMFHGGGSTDFVMLQTDQQGVIKSGKIISLTKTSSATTSAASSFDGHIQLYSLNKELTLSSPISDGYITATHRSHSHQSGNVLSLIQPVQPSPPAGDMLPEVIVIGYIGPSDGISYSEWINIVSVFGGSGGGGGGYYSPMGGSSGSSGDYGGYGSYSGGGGGGATQVPAIQLEDEYIYDIPSVNIAKMFRCFDYVPSVGATYTIKLCTDLPSNDNPNASSNSSGVSAGHTFLTITKTNNDQSVTQSFGFYPQQAPSWLSPFDPVASTLKDNGAQEINASITMSINEFQFNTIKQNAINWSSNNYGLGDYNCTNYALDIFNSVRTNPIVVQPYKVMLPSSTAAYPAAANPVSIMIQKSPQRLFSKLREMKNSNSPEASNILIDQSHNSHAPISKGECD